MLSDISANSLNKISSNFLFAIAHELKTPISAIIGFSEILRGELRDPKAVEDCVYYAKEINSASLELLDIVHDLLDVGAANSGNFTINSASKVDVIDVIRRSIRLNWDYSLQRKITLKLAVQGQEISIKPGAEMENNSAIRAINLDAKRTKQILTNLISNAVKYSPEKSEVKIIVREIANPDALEIAVVDHGFGMSTNEISQLFHPFQTFLNPNSGKVDSSGLGLSITKQLVEMQGGTISVESKPKLGTKFTLQFPYRS